MAKRATTKDSIKRDKMMEKDGRRESRNTKKIRLKTGVIRKPCEPERTRKMAARRMRKRFNLKWRRRKWRKSQSNSYSRSRRSQRFSTRPS
jgi:hypothetical protein